MSTNNPARTPRTPCQVFIVEASAGSGKTYTLAKRYLSLLFSPELSPQDVPLRLILAITFTNKAAFEMKERILELLKKICLDAFDSPAERKDIMAALAVTPEAARRKAGVIMEHLLRNYNFFQVQTIDSFINALLSGCAFKLELSAHFRIRHDRSAYLRYGLDQLIEKAASQKGLRARFDRFLHQYLFLENRTSWFPKADIARIMERMLSYSDTYASPFSRHAGSAGDLVSRKRAIAERIRTLNDRQVEGTDRRFSAKLSMLAAAEPGALQVEDLAAFFDRPRYPATKGFIVPEDVAMLWDRLREDIRALCEAEAFILFNCYIDIFEHFFDEFRQAAAADDVVFLSELNRHARFLFDSGFVTVPELYFRLASRFRDYLIDEFQDTSGLQWRNLFGLIEDGLSRGGTLFFVGDKKQAIYRFRGGEVMLFDQVQQQLAAFGQERTLLSRNFRSCEEIVTFNNELFSQENLMKALSAINERKRATALRMSDEDMTDIAAFFKDAHQTGREDKPGGVVAVNLFEAADEDRLHELIRERLLKLLDSLKERYDWKDIAVLARSNEHVELCAGWLIAAGIPVESDRTLDIRRHPLIKELISLLKFLRSPIDNLAFASFILGDIFLAASGLKKSDVERFLFSLARGKNSGTRPAYYRAFRAAYPRAWDASVEGLFKSVGFVPLYELVVSCLSRLNVLENFPRYQGFFMKLLELIRSSEEEHPTLAEFLRFFEEAPQDELYVDVSGSDAVSVLTVHKSKGLEFIVCICPFVCLDAESGGTVVYPDDSGLSLLRLKKEYTRFSGQLDRIYRLEYKKAFIDELNNLYVAFTRAREELHIFVPGKSKGRFNYARELFSGREGIRGKPVSRTSPSQSSGPVLDLEPSQFKDWIPLLKTEYLGQDEVQNRSARLAGEMLHNIFACLKDLSQTGLSRKIRDAVRTAAAQSAVPFSTDIEERIAAMLARKTWKDFFFSPWAHVLTEWTVVGQDSETKRIDRIVVKDNEAWVIDFKSSGASGDVHREQVRRYISIVSGIYPKKKIRGFLLYFDSDTVEEVYG